jgi:putative nucleotidyltransferase with HDIG domain
MLSITRPDKTKNQCLDQQLREIFGTEFRLNEPDWQLACAHLMVMAEEANKAFQFDKAIRYLDLLEQIRSAGIVTSFSREIEIKLHQERGRAYSFLGKLDEAISEFKKILSFGKGDLKGEIRSDAFTQIGQILAKQGDHEKALGYLQRAISSYRRGHDKIGLCKALRNLGVVYVELGDFDEAEVSYTEAIAIATTTEDRVLYADLINNLGAIMNMKGHWDRALELYKESLQIYKESKEIRKEAYAKNNIGITLTERENDTEAFQYFMQAFEIASKINDRSLRLIVDLNLADLFLKRGSLTNAREHSLQAEKYFSDLKLVNVHLVETKKLIGKIASAESHFDIAEKVFDEALSISREIGSKFHEAEVLLERGKLLSSSKKHFEALTDLENSYQIFRKIKADGRKAQTEKVINSIEHLYLEIFNSIGKQVDQKDSYTKGHSDRVASIALLLAKEIGLNTHMLKTVVAAGLLHDIGKIKISDSILNKPGRLTDEEFAEIKKHPEYGLEMLHGKEFPWDIKPLILHHHERIDGSGYPKKIKGEDIPLGARILCVADVFEALTSNRTYRAAYNTREALKIMKEESGTTFDPVLLKCFLKLVKRGDIDYIVNARTRHDEMYLIWSQCMGDGDKKPDLERDLAAS